MKTVVCIVVAMVLFASAFGQVTPALSKPDLKALKKLASDLKLSPAQYKKMEAASLARFEKLRPIREKVIKGPVTQALVNEHREALRTTGLAYDAQLKKIFTKAQWEKFTQIRAERVRKFKDR